VFEVFGAGSDHWSGIESLFSLLSCTCSVLFVPPVGLSVHSPRVCHSFFIVVVIVNLVFREPSEDRVSLPDVLYLLWSQIHRRHHYCIPS